MDKKIRHNTHQHCFTEDCNAEKFMPLQLVRWLIKNNYKHSKQLGWFLNSINPCSDDDIASKYGNLLLHGSKATQKEVFLDNIKGYSDEFKHVALPMDFTMMNAGKPKRCYEVQLMELIDMYNRGLPIIPFIMATPLNVDFVLEQLKTRPFKGVKLYTLTGYYPQDIRLYPLYQYCNDNNIPIITHCTPSNAVYFRGSSKELTCRLLEYNPHAKTKGKNKDLVYQFADPDNYDILFTLFPKLKIDFAHVGGCSEWDRYMDGDFDNNFCVKVLEKLIKYKGAYADIAFSLVNAGHVAFLKRVILQEKYIYKIMFGDDSYMNETGGGKEPYLTLETYIGSKNYDIITIDVPKDFGLI